MAWLINAAQLDKFRKSQKSLIIFDATYFLSTEKNAREEFAAKHIIEAKFFDITQFADPNGIHHGMVLQDEKILSEKLSALGIRNDYKIIFYDNSDMHTSCRALWMMKLFGHNPNQLYILDGGLSAWEAYEGKTEAGDCNYSAKQYTAQLQYQYLRTLEQMKENVRDPREQVIDVRNPVRFCGGPESRPGLRSGHIPGSFCFPFFTMYEKNGMLKPLEKIRQQMSDVSISLKYPTITTCGSGTTAPVLNFVLDIMGLEQNSVYNGSWTEWGHSLTYAGEASIEERPVETCINDM